MSGFQGTFDANQVTPKQGFDAHPPGMFDFNISNTSIVPTKDNNGGMFVIDFQTPAGKITKRYNIWNQSQAAVDIANKELSALCHATGVFKVDWSNEGAALRGAVGRIEVGPQKNDEQYMEVKRVFDKNGNEPGRPNSAPQTQQQPTGNNWSNPANQQQNNAVNNNGAAANNPPLQQNNAGGWGNQPPTNTAQPQQSGPTGLPQNQWGNQQAPNTNQQQQPAGGNAGGNGAPPWSRG